MSLATFCRFALFALLTLGGLAPLAGAQDSPSEPIDADSAFEDGESALGGNLREFESWIVLEEEIVPDPPLLRVELGFLGVIESRSRIRVDRGTLRGTRLDNLEVNQGLESGAMGPWLTFSLGGKIRGGGDFFQFKRGGTYRRQVEEVIFDGVRLAGPDDLLRANFSFLSLSAFVEWDVLYGRKYRIGFLGGLRYFRLQVELEGVLLRPTPQEVKRKVLGELLSPTFGGLIELTPFPHLTVFSQAQFMNWSWESVGLEDARYFEMRIGARLNMIPEFLSLSLEYRFMIVNATPTLGGTGRRVEGALTINGLVVSIGLSF
ncbi:MAG: hypothetical protein JKY65_00615 [Planctomycetes bacterium]|nr:hypothetical protein [Planctomycetota bacterium]